MSAGISGRRYCVVVRRRRTAPDAISAMPARPINSVGAPVRGSVGAAVAAGAACAAEVVEDEVEAGAVVAAGAAVAGGAVVAGAVDAFFFVCFGVLGALSGSWYCSSPAPSANAAAGVVASSSAAIIDVSTRRDIESLVADDSRELTVTLPRWPRRGALP